MTSEERAAIEARLKAATPGPWKVRGMYVDGPSVTLVSFFGTGGHPEDLHLIAHAKADLATLLAALDASEALSKRRHEALVRTANQPHQYESGSIPMRKCACCNSGGHQTWNHVQHAPGCLAAPDPS